MGGSSDSPKGDDKATDRFGKRDYWILKLNPLGEIEWQHTYGGNADDQLTSIAQTTDGGFWVAGTSSSDTSGTKKSVAIGNEDIWVLRLDARGKVLWERTPAGARLCIVSNKKYPRRVAVSRAVNQSNFNE